MTKTMEFDSELSDSIVALRNDGAKWDEISRQTEVPPGKAMLIYFHATVKPKDKIKNATGADIARLRDTESLSWGMISARTGYPESACRSMYEKETGNSTKGNRIGKGGKYPGQGGGGGGGGKASAKAASGSAKPSILVDLPDDEIKEKLTGYAIKVLTDDGEETIMISAVSKVNKGTIVVKDEEGKARTVKRAAVFQVSKKKVIK